MNDTPSHTALAETVAERFVLRDIPGVHGFIEYYRFPPIVIVTHTEVAAGLEGRGHGSRLAAQALEYFSQAGFQVVPVCGFFAQYLRSRPALLSMATPESRRVFEL